MNVAYISLGSNIEPRKEYIDRALEKLERHEGITIDQQSSIYETAPVDYTDQAHFLNMVVKVKTSLANIDLLEACQMIERELGRDREKEQIEKGPRTIDLDILLFNNENRDLERLRIPHPRMHERAFVLVPLNEIAPDKVMPTSGRRIDELVERLSKKDLDSVVKWDENT